MRVFPRGFCSLLELRPVAVRAQGGPLLVAVLLGRGALVGVAVRRLLNGDVEPVTALAVGEGQHHTLGQQVILLRGHTLEYAVDHRHGLGAGDALVGTEATVGVALDPAIACRELDIGLSPVTGDVAEAVSRLVQLGEQGDDLGHLGAGDGGVRAEHAVGITADDTGVAQGGDGVVVPVAALDVGVRVRGRPILLTGLVGQQTEEDGAGLSAGDVAARLHRAVGITHDVSIVIRSIQRGLARRGGGDHGNIGNVAVGVGDGQRGVLIGPFKLPACDLQRVTLLRDCDRQSVGLFIIGL